MESVIRARRAVESGQFVLYEFVPCIIFDRHLGMPIHISILVHLISGKMSMSCILMFCVVVKYS